MSQLALNELLQLLLVGVFSRITAICIKLDTFLNILAKGEQPLVIVTNPDYFT
ncbi:hypothetical protein PN455_19900 [Dolichospermum circinale CS-539]|uniref:hypothetical protein n=1 Tax=Dolichospermum circinale TaxID=109265 RepID=UPI00232E934B|nr:hypothetical protein [Dolichospermum circinale]MDB9467890.1 hypothetical protein [Dolichospermum circinale CS-539/09]MDB9472842.1 hypothetical protein [Dolichospermum circinale CS-539]